ncbi:unnamed protein product, partial [Rotaria magnacalcarata]
AKTEEPIESMITSNDDDVVVLPGLDLNTEENDKKRKRTTSEVNRNCRREFISLSIND